MSIPTEQPQRPLPPQGEPFGNAVQRKGQLSLRSRRRKASGWAKMLVLVILTSLVVLLGGDIRHRVMGSVTPSLETIAATGPFVQAPLSTDQINKLHHLSSYMTYKTLANSHLSRMTLDQKLGQLFMVQ